MLQTTAPTRRRHGARPWSAILLLAGLLSPTTLRAKGDPGSPAPDPATTPATFVETLTVTATRSERTLEQTPGQVDVITADEIETLGMSSLADLVLFAPGVELAGDLTRLGTNGFTIRGIGGNRVLTQIDGIPTTEQFDFGPLSVNQASLDVDMLERAEIVRSAGSALYGSDALGGVVSLVTRSPRSWLDGRPQVVRLRAGWDGRADQLSESLVYARGNDAWQGSLVATHRDGKALRNQGEVDTETFLRTTPNPIDRRQDNLLAKLGRSLAPGSELELALELWSAEATTEVLSGRTPASPFAGAILDSDAVDDQSRRRLSLEQSLVTPSLLLDSLHWRAHWQDGDTEQQTAEIRQTSLGLADRDGVLRFDERSFGLEATARKALGARAEQLLTYGMLLRRDHFDGLRDRTDVVIATGQPVPTTLTFPTKYFPQSEVDELGLFVQGELTFARGRLRLVPGVRFDRYDLDPRENDAIFLSGNPGQAPAVALTDEAISPKLGLVVALGRELSLFAQVARGFRAPPMSDVNNGFTNPAGGYRTLPNPELEPETSTNLELGLRGNFSRGSVSVTMFENRYDDFIETLTIGFDPVLGLIEFQPRNVQTVEISGIELAGDLRFGKSLRLRAAASVTEGDDLEAGEPLGSIAPPRLVAGLRYAPPNGRFGAELIANVVAAKDADELPQGSTQFATPSYQTFDLAAWVALGRRLALQVSGSNLGDETYWQWAYVRGQSATSPTLDRYTSPGRTFGFQLRAHF